MNRNPGVITYITEALKLIVPAIFGDNDDDDDDGSHSRRRSEELLVEIYDQAKMITFEQFSLVFSSSNEDDIGVDITSAALTSSLSLCDPESNLASSIIGEVERELRDLVISTGKLGGLRSCAWDDSVSFKILLLINPTTMAAVDSALNGTRWFRTMPMPGRRTENRVVYNIPNSACLFRYRQMMRSQYKITENILNSSTEVNHNKNEA